MSSWLLPLGLVSAALGAVCCSSGEAPAEARLRFLYDESARRVVVVTPEVLGEGARLHVRVRRGNLTPTSEKELDCAAVAKGSDSVVDLASSTPAPSGQGRAYRGPRVPESVPLTEFFDDNVIVNDPTPAQAAEMKAGVNSIVEGCLFQGTELVAKVQTSLLRAWDDATPDLVAKVAASDDGKASAAPPVHAVSTYGQLCEEELGEIPFFPKQGDGSYGTYDCSGPDSVPIPITVTDGNNRTTEATSVPERCDRPDWLRTSCAPFARISKKVNREGTRWVLLCRGMGRDHDEKTKVYNDVALIGHNPKSGKACFFQNALYFKNDAARVPSPADPKRAEHMWASFKGDACNSCHDSDPFIHSPWIDQAKDKDGKHVVPYLGEDPDYPIGGATPYRLVGAVANGWAARRHVTSAEAKACTSCHRIADGASLFGEDLETPGESWTARSIGGDARYAQSVTPSFQAFARSHWMPPSLGNLTEATWPSSEMGKAAAFLLECAQAGTCRYSAIPFR